MVARRVAGGRRRPRRARPSRVPAVRRPRPRSRIHPRGVRRRRRVRNPFAKKPGRAEPEPEPEPEPKPPPKDGNPRVPRR